MPSLGAQARCGGESEVNNVLNTSLGIGKGTVREARAPRPTWAVRGKSSNSAHAGAGTELRASSSSPSTSTKRHFPATPSRASTCGEETRRPGPRRQASGGGRGRLAQPAPPREPGRSPPPTPCRRDDTARSAAHTWLSRSPGERVGSALSTPSGAPLGARIWAQSAPPPSIPHQFRSFTSAPDTGAEGGCPHCAPARRCWTAQGVATSL